MKKIVSIAIICAMLFSLAACGDGSVAENDDGAVNNSEQGNDVENSNDDLNNDTDDNDTDASDSDNMQDGEFESFSADELVAYIKMLTDYRDKVSCDLKEGSVEIKNREVITNYSKRSVPNLEDGQIFDISMDDISNKDVYTNFSDKQLNKLNEDGFVVMEQNFDDYLYTFMHSQYEKTMYNDNLSLYITSDMVLNMFHMYYAESLKAYETNVYYADLNYLASNLSIKFIDKYNNASDVMKDRYKYLAAYAMTGYRLLMEDAQVLDEDYSSKDSILSVYNGYIDEYNEFMKTVPSEVLELSDVELLKAQTAEIDLGLSEIFRYDISYTQFKPRGHYNQTEVLSRYFKSMMWYSLGGFKLDIDAKGMSADEKNAYAEAVLLSAELVNDEDMYARWMSIYGLTSVYSGKSDDLLPLDIVFAAIDVYGVNYKNIIDGNAEILFADEFADKVIESIDKLPMPAIIPVTSEESDFDLPTCRILKLMGQRYSIDQTIVASLMVPRQKEWFSSFEFFTVLGSEKAREVFYEYYDPRDMCPKYDDILAAAVENYDENKYDMWGDSLYDAWAKSIDVILNKGIVGNQPKFLTTESYKYKNLNTALGSFAELKHDNVLYAKQSFAEMGGMPIIPVTLHYLEPNVELYTNLYNAALNLKYTLQNMGKENIIKDYTLDRLIETLNALCVISEKELKNEDLSNEELTILSELGGLADYIKNSFGQYINLYSLAATDDLTGSLVSDIGGFYTELGTGLPQEIYVLTRVNGQDIMCKGMVYSAYEFNSNERLTDEQWHDALHIFRHYDLESEGYNEEEILEMLTTPEEWKLFNAMPYTKKFMVDDDNDVLIKPDSGLEW